MNLLELNPESLNPKEALRRTSCTAGREERERERRNLEPPVIYPVMLRRWIEIYLAQLKLVIKGLRAN
jgi:hypothetical protein